MKGRNDMARKRTITIKIDIDNDAFYRMESHETVNVLKNMITHIECESLPVSMFEDVPIRDSNGNKCGSITLNF
jgi:hypothetical protein